MTAATSLLTTVYEQIRDLATGVIDGLDDDVLATRVDGSGNSIAWLVWHAFRVQDDHVADVAGTAQVWTADGWVDRFGLELDPADTGYGHSAEQVAAVRAPSDLLAGYAEAVSQRTLEYVQSLTDDDLERVVDTRWDPPVTLGVRLASVVGDDLQHLGQAAYARGLLT
ncbi:mycothiol transferase [Angustibacter aerolatus]